MEAAAVDLYCLRGRYNDEEEEEEVEDNDDNTTLLDAPPWRWLPLFAMARR